MEGFDPSFGPEVAARYDDHPRGDEDETVRFLAALADGRRALEFAIGTGRIALPLRAAGVPVDGVELSPHMVEQLRAKPGGEAVEIVLGDMGRDGTGREYGLVYLVFNTIGNLLTQDRQIECFQNAARHLASDGVFVIECTVPDAPSRPRRQFVDVERLEVDHIGLDVNRYDPVTQILSENHVHIGADGIRFTPIELRVTYPAELDLMARLAGLRLANRWGGWREEPFTAESWRHVSVYQRATS